MDQEKGSHYGMRSMDQKTESRIELDQEKGSHYGMRSMDQKTESRIGLCKQDKE